MVMRAVSAEDEIARLKEEVRHWQEARQNAITGGNMLLKQVQETLAINAIYRKALDQIAQSDNFKSARVQCLEHNKLALDAIHDASKVGELLT